LKQLAVIIVSYNVKALLHQCLTSVARALDDMDGEVWVVDNASQDGSAAWVEQHFPWVRLIASEENLGFGRANNLAVAQSQSKHVLFLNPDTVVPEHQFRHAILYLQDHPKVGSLGCRMIDGAGDFLPESKRGLPTPMTALYRLSGLAKLFPKHAQFGRYYWGELEPEASGEVEVHCGAWMWTRREVIDQVGAFDEAFFMYGEDIDLSYRILQAGWQNHYLGHLPVIHYKGESTKHASWNYVKTFYQAMQIYARKHIPNGAGLFAKVVQLGILLRGAMSAFKHVATRLTPPLVDSMASIAVLWWITNYWEVNHRYVDGGTYPDLFKYGMIPAFQLFWVAGLWLTGGFRRGANVRSVLLGWMLGSGLLFTAYALLPEPLRYSRALLILGALAFLSVTWLRRLLSSWWFGSRDGTAIVAHVGGQYAGSASDSIHYDIRPIELSGAVETLQINQIVFYPEITGYQYVIDHMLNLKSKGIKFRMAYPEQQWILGSDSSNQDNSKRLPNLSQVRYRRQKRGLDLVIAAGMVPLLPILIFNGAFRKMYGSWLSVGLGKSTWVGTIDRDLRPGILLQSPEHESLLINKQSDDAYIEHWSPDWDLRAILREARS